MDFKLELVIIPVTDVDRAKDFYMERAGFRLDVDHRAGEDFRIVQLTPAGSACSVTLMRNPDAAGSVQGLHLIVTDIDAARAELTGRGVAASEVFHFGAEGQTPGPDPQRGQLQLVPVVQRPGWQRLARAGGQGRRGSALMAADRRRCDAGGKPRPTVTRPRSTSWPGCTAGSCTCTATGCWPRSMTPRTRSRRPCCGPGAGAELSRPGRRGQARPIGGSGPRRSTSTCVRGI